MTKEVMVTISGLQIAEAEQDTVELVHIGEYYERNGTHYIFFDELLEGIPEPVKNVIKIKDRCLEVQKKGPVVTKLVFEEGKSQRSTYTIPFGSFLIETSTNSVQVHQGEERLEAAVAYGLEINGAHCADCDIRVLVQTKESFRL
ncbi:MAG: DUF1934 domain-containing protein [Clostridiales bacterium]|nr:DUF1934 domain-containing protein [Clostridiales bacterium]